MSHKKCNAYVQHESSDSYGYRTLWWTRCNARMRHRVVWCGYVHVQACREHFAEQAHMVVKMGQRHLLRTAKARRR